MTEQIDQHAQTARPMTIRACGRSFMALVLTPMPPLAEWLAALDHQMSSVPAFLAGKPVILDLGLLTADTEGLSELLNALRQLGLRPVSIEGGDRDWAALEGWDFPNPLTGGRDHALPPPGQLEAAPHTALPETPQHNATAPRTLYLDNPVRSGQIVTWLEGDIVVSGGIAPGAELIASGSIHIYGALRGRAIAGVGGNSAARIFARRMFAELLAIDGFYMTAEEIDQQLAGQPAQALLIGEQVTLQPLT